LSAEENYFFRITKVGLFLLVSQILIGCTAPYATISLKPYSETNTEIIGPNYPDIQQALSIIDLVLVRNGYVNEWSYGTNTIKGWRFVKDYGHHHPAVFASVYSEGRKEASSQFKAGKGSVRIYVSFEENMRFFLKPRRKVIQVRDEIAQELNKRFGQGKVTVFEGQEEMPLQ
jgi:hypothetical protein